MKTVGKLLFGLMASFVIFNQAGAAYENKEEYLERVYGKDRYETNIATIHRSFIKYDKVSVGYSRDIESLVSAINHSVAEKIPFVLSRDSSEDLDKIEGLQSGVKAVNTRKPVSSKKAVVVNHMSDLLSALTYVVKNEAEIIFDDGTNLGSLPDYESVLVVGGAVKDPHGFRQISGKDRYETNRLVNKEFGSSRGYLVSGENYADAISCINMVLKSKEDIILTKNDGSSVDVNNTNIAGVVGGAVRVERKILYVNPHQDDELMTMGLDLLRTLEDNRKNTHLVLMTDGAATNSIYSINDRLEKEGLEKITRDKIVISRNKEMIDCLQRLGMMKDNIHFDQYPNLSLSMENVYKFIDDFYNEHKNIELRTMSANYLDESRGIPDHLACKDAVKKFADKYRVKATYISQDGGGLRLIPNEKEKKKIRDASKAYCVWEPNDNRYAVGFTSISDFFKRFDKDDFRYSVH